MSDASFEKASAPTDAVDYGRYWTAAVSAEDQPQQVGRIDVLK